MAEPIRTIQAAEPVRLNGSSEVRFDVSQFASGGSWFFTARIWNHIGDLWLPSKRAGLTLHASHYTEVMDALEQVGDALRREGVRL